MPFAFNAASDEDIVKFEKRYDKLYTAIWELISSEKYHMDGDLAYKTNDDRIDETHEDD